MVAHDGVVVGDAVGAEDVAREAGALEAIQTLLRLAIEMCWCSTFARIFQAADLQHQS